MMQSKAVVWVTGFAIAAFSGIAVAENLVIYPAKGQSAEQQSKDELECQGWAKQNTGVDPLALASEAAQPPPVSAAPADTSRPGGQRVKGAARGAVGGAAIGAIAGDAGKGAAIGAVGGTMAGGARKRREGREAATTQQSAQADAQQQAAAHSAEVQQKLATFNKAYAACLEGKGYSVK
jgi:YMGG-like Gly-zipper